MVISNIQFPACDRIVDTLTKYPIRELSEAKNQIKIYNRSISTTAAVKGWRLRYREPLVGRNVLCVRRNENHAGETLLKRFHLVDDDGVSQCEVDIPTIASKLVKALRSQKISSTKFLGELINNRIGSEYFICKTLSENFTTMADGVYIFSSCQIIVVENTLHIAVIMLSPRDMTIVNYTEATSLDDVMADYKIKRKNVNAKRIKSFSQYRSISKALVNASDDNKTNISDVPLNWDMYVYFMADKRFKVSDIKQAPGHRGKFTVTYRGTVYKFNLILPLSEICSYLFSGDKSINISQACKRLEHPLVSRIVQDSFWVSRKEEYTVRLKNVTVNNSQNKDKVELHQKLTFNATYETDEGEFTIPISLNTSSLPSTRNIPAFVGLLDLSLDNQ